MKFLSLQHLHLKLNHFKKQNLYQKKNRVDIGGWQMAHCGWLDLKNDLLTRTKRHRFGSKTCFTYRV